MNKTKILFRADGNSQTGLGHLYRLFALVEMVKEEYDFVFLTRETSTLEVIPADYTIELIPKELSLYKELEWINKKYLSTNCIIIADGYQFDSDYQKKLKTYNFQFIYIDDLVVNKIYADTVINHGLDAKNEQYNAILSTNFGLGSDFAILRPAFIESLKIKREITEIETAFICFGGADPNNLTFRALEAILSFDSFLKIHVLVGAAYNHPEIFEIEKDNSKVQVHKNLNESEIVALMQQCDLAIVPSSNILYEVCSINMFVISGYYVENQESIYASAVEQKIIQGVGDFNELSSAGWIEQIKSFLNTIKDNEQLIHQQSMFNQDIVPRFKKLIKILENDQAITLRRADENDVETTYSWATSKKVRQFSFNQDEITLEGHTQWYMNKIQSNYCIYFIAEYDNKPVGSIRFDLKHDEAIISYLIDPEMHGKGFGMNILKSGLKYFQNEHMIGISKIVGFVMPDNMASSIIFERFMFQRELEGTNYKFFKNIA